MKSAFPTLAGLRSLAAAAVLLVAVFGPAAAQDKGTVYYLAPTLFDEFQVESKNMIEKAVGSLGYKVTTLDALNRADEQLNQFDNIIALKPAAIVLAAVDFSTIIPGIQKARAAGIPVLIYDRQIKDTEVDLTSVAGTVEIGRMSGKEIVRLLTERHGAPKGKVLDIMGDPGDAYTLDIEDGFQEVIKQYPDIAVITKPAVMWEPVNAANIADDQLQVNKDIDFIFMHADHLGPPVVQVLEKHGYKKGDIMLLMSAGMPVGLDLIREGWAHVVVEQPLYGQVYGLAMFLDKIVRKEPLEPGSYDIIGLPSTLSVEKWGPNLKVPGHAITAANVDDTANWGNLTPPAQPVTPVP